MATAPVEVPATPVKAVTGAKATVPVGGDSPPSLNIVEILKRLEGKLETVDYLDSLQLQSIGIGVAPSTDGLKIVPGGVTRRAILVKGLQFQSANLLEVQDCDGNVIYQLAPDGDVEHNVSGTVDAFAVKHNGRVFLGVTTQKDKEYLELGNETDQPALRIYGPARGGETTGTDADGSDLVLAGGRGRGAGAGGHLLFKTSAAGATGTDYNTETTLLEITDDAKIALFGATPVVQQTDIGALTDNTGETPDNTIASVDADYASISVYNNSTATTIDTQNQWEQVLIFDTDGPENGSNADHTNDHITVPATAVYEINISLSFSGGGSKTYEIQVQKNNGATAHTELSAERKLNSNGDVGSVTISGQASLTANDTMELWIRCTDVTTADATLKHVNYSLKRIDSGADANQNISDLVDQINGLRTAVRNLGMMA